MERYLFSSADNDMTQKGNEKKSRRAERQRVLVQERVQYVERGGNWIPFSWN